MDPTAFVAANYQPTMYEPLGGCIAYAVIVWALKQRTKEISDTVYVPIAIVHNGVLIAISVALFIGGILALKSRYDEEGFDGIFCSQRSQLKVLDGAPGFWIMVFYLSKYYELIDTFLLCLKKKETIFLHLYHHASMLWLCWSWARFGWLEGSLWCVIVNGFIHTLMYTYYLLTALKMKAWWKKYLTSMQILQFVTGFVYTNIYLWSDFMRQGVNGGGGCGAVERRYCAIAAHAVNISFIFLFAQFYVRSYAVKKKGKDA